MGIHQCVGPKACARATNTCNTPFCEEFSHRYTITLLNDLHVVPLSWNCIKYGHKTLVHCEHHMCSSFSICHLPTCKITAFNFKVHFFTLVLLKKKLWTVNNMLACFEKCDCHFPCHLLDWQPWCVIVSNTLERE